MGKNWFFNEITNVKTRILKTRFWDDSIIQSLSLEAKYLLVYFLSSPFIGLTCFFEISLGQIRLHTSLSQKKLQKALKELEEKKRLFFYNNWVFIPNLDKHNPYFKSVLTKKAYDKELKNLPVKVLDYFKNKKDTTIHTTIHSTIYTPPIPQEIRNNKIEIRNNKIEIRNKKQEIRKEINNKRKELIKKISGGENLRSLGWKGKGETVAKHLKISLEDKNLEKRWLNFFKVADFEKIDKVVNQIAGMRTFRFWKDEVKMKFFFGIYYLK